MKKIITLLALLALAIDINAYDFEVKNADGVTIYYNYINEGKEVEVTFDKYYKQWNSKTLEYDYYYGGYRDYYDKTLTIPETVIYNERTYPVTKIGTNAFRDSYIKFIELPNSINKLGSNSFQDSNIEEITIPEGVTEIPGTSFSGCLKLKKVSLPEGLKEIRSHSFDGCKLLTEVTIPESITVLEGFTNCSGLTSITIPKNVTSVYFYGCENLLKIYSYIMEPRDLTYPSTAFTKNSYYSGTLYVPKGTVDKYKSREGWKSFTWIEEMSGADDKKCATPTISYQFSQLSFSSETEGATFVTNITDADIKTHYDASIYLTATYNISVYATKAGYENSDVATATLSWLDGELETDISGGAANVRAKAVLIQSNGSTLSIAGLNEGTAISVYDLSGKMVGSTISASETTNISTSLRPGDIGLVKIGNKTIKIIIK